MDKSLDKLNKIEKLNDNTLIPVCDLGEGLKNCDLSTLIDAIKDSIIIYCTQEEYTSIEYKKPNTFYCITND